MSTVAAAYPVARKVHVCSSCRRRIEPGERYYRWVGTNDMWVGLAVDKNCAECCERYGRPLPCGVTRLVGVPARTQEKNE